MPPRLHPSLLIAALLLPLSATAVEMNEMTFATTRSQQLSCRYLLALPADYPNKPNHQWPLVVFLHGAGERGDDLDLLKKHGPPKLIAAGQDLGAVVVSPQVPAGEVWNPLTVHALTEEIAATHRIDRHRLYLTGISMGGFGTWETALEFPDTYAAIAPICGGAGVRFLLASRIKHLPVWIFHGDKDTVVEPANSQRMYDQLKHLGADVQFTLYPRVGHDSWTQTYENPEFWAWLRQQKRP